MRPFNPGYQGLSTVDGIGDWFQESLILWGGNTHD